MRGCPEAFVEEDNDNAQLILDNLDENTFNQVSRYVDLYTVL